MSPPAERPQGVLRLVAALVILLVLLAGAFVVWSVAGGDDSGDSASVRPVDESNLDLPAGDEPVPAGAGAPTPEAAVEGFLAAEQAGDFETSFTYLAPDARRAYGSASGWIAAHADVMPPVRGYEVGARSGGGSEAEVASAVTFEPGLDEIVGLVPSAADVTWRVVEGEGGWGVDLESSSMEPRYPSDDSAPDAVEAWAEARQRCTVSGQWSGTLLGAASRAESLCDTTGEVAAGEPQPLDEFDSAPFTAAFGGDVVTWARVVPLSSPVDLRVVVAPVGDEWQVIGVLP